MNVKIIIAAVIFFLFVSSMFPLISADDEAKYKSLGQEQGFSFSRFNHNVTFDGWMNHSDDSWYVVRFSSDQPIFMENITFSVNQTMNENYNGFTGICSRFTLTNFNTTINTVIIDKLSVIREHYLQVNLGPIQFVRQHWNRKESVVGVSGSARVVISDPLPAGDWYFIFFTTPLPQTTFSIHLEAQSNGNITWYHPTLGFSSVMVETQHLHGKIVYWKQLGNFQSLFSTWLHPPIDRDKSLILDGEFTYQVNHTFVGFFMNPDSYQYDWTHIHVVTPEGKSLDNTQIIFRNHILKKQGNFDYWDMITGGNGTWTFQINRREKGTPAILFLGADITLPDEPLG